ncbi:MAG TPA: ribosome maturation factor RimM [Patescibacteria group bacterium]|nr:ribosome maturation factor RimM [Patescibacteria group bacterium]
MARGRVAAPGAETVPVATNLRLRGADGRMTASLVRGGIDQLEGHREVLVGRAGDDANLREIETYETYGHKVVVKFRGVDTAAEAAPLEGLDILMPCNGLVDLPEGAYYIFELVGMRVRTSDGRDLGVVRRVVETGGAPLLVVEGAEPVPQSSRELLIPAARSICTRIDRRARIITVDPPEGLLEL